MPRIEMLHSCVQYLSVAVIKRAIPDFFIGKLSDAAFRSRGRSVSSFAVYVEFGVVVWSAEGMH